ncbi:PREDICTED: uncharacterized protein LOC107345474 isoform X1 [Acropora digitifera]|uniref:uncharacterized protein LOC107345474 isoform X1 n=1 Tax=Acropora digitifera TaxID=70779 RepID=UPI000779F4DB|nr:PREDICTED: uncharacterized protein LOC107345474 isoform X1 [Acropora digitifera]
MAAISSAVRLTGMSSRNLRPFVWRMPSVIHRSMSDAPTLENGNPGKADTPTAGDGTTYQVQEYFSYNEYSFYDLENVIDASGRRQVQPDPRVMYNHTDPWKTMAETSAA